MQPGGSLWLDPSWDPEHLTLQSEDVHVWRASLDLGPPVLARLWAVLSEDEQSRARRFHFERDRRRFVAARGQLRVLLGHYLGQHASSMSFAYEENGKPFLAGSQETQPLRFNVSHSGSLALAAISLARQVGVDIELLRTDLAGLEIAERFFSPTELASLKDLPVESRTQGFFNCWTRKEAFIKARGDGLSLPLHDFDVSLVPGAPAALLSTTFDPDEASRWSLAALDPDPDYAAAVAAEGHDWRLTCWQLFPDSPWLLI